MKIIKLIQNETIKTWKKTSTKILIILSIVALIGAVGFAKLIISLTDYTSGVLGNQEWEIMTKQRINELKEVISETSKYDEITIAQSKAELDVCEIALKYKINNIYYYNDYWKLEILDEITLAKNEIYLGKNVEANQKLVDQRIASLDKDDYLDYLEEKKKEYKTELDNKQISQEEYEDQIYLLELRKKYDIYKEPTKDILGWKEHTYEDICLMKETLRTGIDKNTGKMLKINEIENLENNIKIAEYRLEKDIPNLDSTSSARGLYDAMAPQFSMLLVALLMVIIAGSSVSTEVSKGTIKFLLFTPNKRWKVLLSKILSAVLILLVLTILLSLLSTIIGNVFFEEQGTEYVYVSSNGEVHSLPNIIYTMLYFLASTIDILIYMLFAFMFSVLTRNTALAVGISVGCYVGSGIVMNLINYYISADWVKFIPFNNLGIADQIFTNNISYSTMQMASEALSGNSVGFSLAVLGVCSVLMIVSMFDSFNKRDIV